MKTANHGDYFTSGDVGADIQSRIVGDRWAGKTEPTLSLCMMVKNEEACLERCLTSARSNVNEIIVVDTGSTDRTVEIATAFGAQVYHHPWESDFSKHRNQSLSYATGDWILILDADEEFHAGDLVQLKTVIREGDADYYFCCLQDIRNDGTVHGTFNQIRLFRNHRGMHYTQKVHNQFQPQGTGAFTTIKIRHYGYDLPPDKMEVKHLRTTTLLLEMLENNPDDLYSRHQLASSYSMHREFSEAVQHGEIALEIRRRKGLTSEFIMTTFYTVAQGYYALDNPTAAERIGLEALDVFPLHLDICHLLAAIYFKQRAPGLCRDMSERYLRIYEQFMGNPALMGGAYFQSLTKRSEIYFGLACLLSLERTWDAADDYFCQAFNEGGRRPKMAENIYRLYADERQEGKARQWLISAYEAGLREGVIPGILRENPARYLIVGETYLQENRLFAAADCLAKAADESLTREEMLQKMLACVRLSWRNSAVEEMIRPLESLMIMLDVGGRRSIESLEDLGRIVYDLTEALCVRKYWHLAEPALQLAVQMAPALFDPGKFTRLLSFAENADPLIFSADSAENVA